MNPLGAALLPALARARAEVLLALVLAASSGGCDSNGGDGAGNMLDGGQLQREPDGSTADARTPESDAGGAGRGGGGAGASEAGAGGETGPDSAGWSGAGASGAAGDDMEGDAGSGECAGEDCEPDACVEATTRSVDCGRNGAGVQVQRCSEGRWEDEGSCDDPDVCSNGASRDGAHCGLNGRGRQPQRCSAGQWQNDGACADPDECTDGAMRSVTCEGSGLQEQGCSAGQWEALGSCVPEAWDCRPDTFDTRDGCDCECGAYDPDCNEPEQDVYGCIGDEICNAQALCEDPTPVPEGWTCPVSYYDDDDCDCGCGIIDSDCPSAAASECEFCLYGCSPSDCSRIDPEDNATCVPGGGDGGGDVPSGWSCDPDKYDARDGCDCECGISDPDCEVEGQDLRGCNSGEVCNQARCQPEGWHCPALYWDDGSCDCGCGIRDVDCASADESACEFCIEEFGSCSPDDCSAIDPNDNASCL